MSHTGDNVIVICLGNALKFPTASFRQSGIECHFQYIGIWVSRISRKAVRSFVAPESGHFTVSNSSCGGSVRHKRQTFFEEVRMARTPLEVVLVNSKSTSTPHRANALAQANLDGGGNTNRDLAKNARSAFVPGKICNR